MNQLDLIVSRELGEEILSGAAMLNRGGRPLRGVCPQATERAGVRSGPLSLAHARTLDSTAGGPLGDGCVAQWPDSRLSQQTRTFNSSKAAGSSACLAFIIP